MALYGALAEAVRKGWSIEFGTVALAGNPTSVATNVTIQGAMVCLNTKTALALLTHAVTYFVEAATPNQLDIYGWKPTSSSVTTLVAATDTEPVTWIVWGPIIA
ncbi:hypothetical protein LCGC14_2713650 [marine sediment metagenome]|uniref:Uncharacterized protein n=1 Tax=marine sediment metagenome TaxID=412755 RepID=A0A0F9BLB4_9ZZZZ